MAGYRYRGTRLDFPLDCRGRYGGGDDRHRYRGEPVCLKCKAVKKDINARRRSGRPLPKVPVTSRIKCGTNSGYQKHMRDRTPPCDPCLEAHAEAKRNWCRKTVDTHSE